MVRLDLHEENRLAWNAATRAHNSHKADQVAFFRGGGSTLFPEELALLGDVAGCSLAHLQCNAGQDSLSLAGRGALVTGVDISDEAIAFAQALAAASGIAAMFCRADLYDWFERMAQGSECFDVVFCSYGAVCWLSDVRRWAQGVAAVLKPGGRFAMVEFHPFAMMFNDDGVLHFPYTTGGQAWVSAEGVGDYVAASGEALTPSGYLEGVRGFQNPHRAHEFFWGVGDVVDALLGAGLQVLTLREYVYANGFRPFRGMRELPGRRMVAPEPLAHVPLMYGLAARKAGG